MQTLPAPLEQVCFFNYMQRDDHSATCVHSNFLSFFFFPVGGVWRRVNVSLMLFFFSCSWCPLTFFSGEWLKWSEATLQSTSPLLFSQHCHLLPYSVASAPFGTNVASPLTSDWSYCFCFFFRPNLLKCTALLFKETYRPLVLLLFFFSYRYFFSQKDIKMFSWFVCFCL